MKQSLIRAGARYSDGKQGIRQVLELGSPTTEGRDAKVRYTIIHGRSIGATSTMTLGAFAAWATQEIPDDQLQNHIDCLRARELAPRLSVTQRAFLARFDSDLTKTESSECDREEFRAAQACRKRGLIACMPERLAPHDRYFDVILSALGIATVRVIKGDAV